MIRLARILCIMFLLMLGCSANYTYAQDGPLASVAAGVSIPSGDFAKSEFKDPASGFAQVGFNLNLLFGYMFNDYAGICALVTGNVHSFDYSAIKDGFREEFGVDFQTIEDILVNTKQWGSGGVLAGGLFSLPLGNRLSIDFKVIGGFLYVYSPEIRLTVESQTDPATIIIEDARAITFAWDLGAGLRYGIQGSKYLILQFDYLGAQPYFKDQKTYYSFAETQVNSFKQDMRMMNITLGLGYFIN